MRRNKLVLSSFIMTSVMLFAQTAYADNTIVPGTTVASTESSSTASTSSSGSSASSTAGVISQTGPGGSKQYNENGYLVVGNGNTSSNGQVNVIGPGSTTTSSSGTASASGNAASSAASSASSSSSAAAAQISIDSSIAKPTVSAEAAVLYDATTRQVLFEKNGSKAMSPASTTKLLTALLSVEKLGLTDTFTFNSTAVDNLESGAVTAGMKAGDSMKVEDALYAMLLRSSCEVANGLAEKVSGSQSEFAALMNQRAKELGCTSSNFTNASGLNSDNHYATAQDLAIITAAALDNATIKQILQTQSYTLPATSSRAALAIRSSNRFVLGTESYEGYVAGKTGYTSKAGRCLASEADYSGHRLIAVTLKSSDSSTQYSDSKALFDYGKKLITAAGAASAGNSGTAASANTGSTTASAGTGTTGSSLITPGTTAGNTTGSQTTASNSQSGSAATAKWVDNGNNTWKYLKANGSYCKNEWLDLNGSTYFFGSDELMCTGWKQFTNGDWYYFNPENGAMVSGKWVTQNGKSYYLQKDGTMARSKVIDNKYRVDENGVYVEKVG